MITTIFVSVIALFFAYISSQRKYGLVVLFKMAFIMVTLIQVIHYDYGSDYMTYYNQHFLYTGTLENFIHRSQLGAGAYRSIAWAVVNRVFPGEIGFFFIVALISVIENVVFYKFITQNVERKDYWKAFAIYVFTTSMYVTNFSALRQGFSVALVVLTMMLISKRKIIPAIAILVVAISFHTSAAVMIPFLLLFFFPLKKGKRLAAIISVMAALFFLSNALLNSLFTGLVNTIPYISSKYGLYFEEFQPAESLGLGFALRLVMFIILIYFMAFRYDEFTYENRFFLLLSCIDLCIIPFQVNLSGMISRIEYYFVAFQVTTIPVVYGKIKNRPLRLCAFTIFFFLTLFGYYQFFFVTEWSATSYRYFHTIFDVLIK